MEVICKWVFVCEIKFKHGRVNLVTSKFKNFNKSHTIYLKKLVPKLSEFLTTNVASVLCCTPPFATIHICTVIERFFFGVELVLVSVHMPSGVGVPQDEGRKYIATAEAPRHFCYHGPYS